MKNYKDITYRYLKGQRNRTLLTILGIILSVAMVSAIGTIIVSARGAMLKESIRDNGSYHGVLSGVDKEVAEKLRNHVDVEQVALAKSEGFAAIVETTEAEREDYNMDIPYRYIEIQGYDTKARDLLPINLKEGRLPQSPDEIILEKWMLNFIGENIKIGDKISLNLGQRDIKFTKDADGHTKYESEKFNETGQKEYTIVGFIEPRYSWMGNLVTKAITGFDSDENPSAKYGAYFTVNNVKKAQDLISNVGKDLGIKEDNIMTNYQVLRLYAQSGNPIFDNSLMGIVIFVVALIMVSTIAVIYNAFNISVLERISEFGLLRSIGATPKQIRAIVFKEATIISAISIPIGLVSGVIAMKIVIYIIVLIQADIEIFNNMEAETSWMVFLISSLVGLATVFLSALGPARRAGKVSPLEAVRNTGELKKENVKKTKSSKFIKKTMGIEGEIARKNLRRNRRRLIITVFSMVISIVLFIVFSTFSDYLFKIGAVDTGNSIDFEVYGRLEGKEDEIYNRLIAMEDIDRIYKISETSGEALLEESKISKKLLEMSPYLLDVKEDEKIRLGNVELATIGNDNLDILKKLLKSGSIDIDKMNRENGVLVINDTYIYKKNSNSQMLLEGFHLKLGDKVPFASYNYDMEGKYTEYTDLTVVGVLEKGILNIKYNYNGSITMITTDEVYEKLYSNKDISESSRENYTSLSIEMAKDGNRQNILDYLNELDEDIPQFHFTDMAQRAKEERNAAIVMSIFLYGFITLIAIISAINIINTISTNIILRTREIAMIKAVGMTQRGIKKMVALESVFYGLYGAILGGSIGIGLTYILHNLVVGISEFEYKVPWKNVVIASLGALIISLISGAYPLKRINEKIIVESMKTEN